VIIEGFVVNVRCATERFKKLNIYHEKRTQCMY